MDDSQINLAIAKIEFWDEEDRPEVKTYYDGSVYFPYRPRWGLFNYCKNWKDIGPIIEREKIDLMWTDDADWMAAGEEGGVEVYAETPTKAASLCYLKMKGVEA